MTETNTHVVPSSTLLAMMVSGYLETPKWIDLSNEAIAQLEKVPFWLTELSVTKDRKEAEAMLWQAHSSKQGVDFNSLMIGFMYLLYAEKRISFSEFLYKLGAFSDGHNYETDCSFFYSILNDLEGRSGKKAKSEEELLPVLIQIIQREVDLVKQQLSNFSAFEKTSYGVTFLTKV